MVSFLGFEKKEKIKDRHSLLLYYAPSFTNVAWFIICIALLYALFVMTLAYETAKQELRANDYYINFVPLAAQPSTRVDIDYGNGTRRAFITKEIKFESIPFLKAFEGVAQAGNIQYSVRNGILVELDGKKVNEYTLQISKNGEMQDASVSSLRIAAGDEYILKYTGQ